MICTCGEAMTPMLRRYNMNQLRYDCCAKGLYASPKATRAELQELLGMEVKEQYFSFYCPECRYGTGIKVRKTQGKLTHREKQKEKRRLKRLDKQHPIGLRMTMVNGKAATARIR